MTNSLVTQADTPPDLPLIPGMTRLQSAFIRAYVSAGTGNATAAARNAGYSSSSAHSTGHRLIHDPDVLEAIQRATAQSFGSIAPMALRTMKALLKHKSGFVQMQAAADLMDRAGHKAIDKHQVAVAGRIVIDIDMGD